MEQNQILLNFMRLLGNAERLKIAGALSVESLTANQVAERLGLSLSEAQQHLDTLAGADLVLVHGETYSLETKTLELLSRQVLAQSHPPRRGDEFEGDDYERKVLSNYIAADGTLKTLPTQYKKMLAVARHLVKIFEPGQRYPEKQVNEMLHRYHPDTASLRRFMVDNHLLERVKGIYWRS